MTFGDPLNEVDFSLSGLPALHLSSNLFVLQVFKVIKVLLTKIEKASEDPESAINQTGE